MSFEPVFEDGDWAGGRRGGGTWEGSWERIVSLSVLAQLGDGSGGRNFGEQKEMIMGTGSEPVDGRGVSHKLKAGDSRELV